MSKRITQSFTLVPDSLAEELSPVEGKILMKFWALSRKQGYCFMRNKRIAQQVGCSERYVRQTARKLEKLGVIESEAVFKNGYQQPNRVTVNTSHPLFSFLGEQVEEQAPEVDPRNAFVLEVENLLWQAKFLPPIPPNELRRLAFRLVGWHSNEAVARALMADCTLPLDDLHSFAAWEDETLSEAAEANGEELAHV